MIQVGGGDGINGLSWKGLIFETWKIRWIRLVQGSLSQTATVLIIFSMMNALMNLLANFLDSTLGVGLGSRATPSGPLGKWEPEHNGG